MRNTIWGVVFILVCLFGCGNNFDKEEYLRKQEQELEVEDSIITTKWRL